jgi:phosphoribosylamine--glycine ligase
MYGKFDTVSGRRDSVIFEEYVSGKEVSMHFITDGNNCIFIGDARDYKKALDGDTGLNTAGMGSYSPCGYVDNNTYQRIVKTIIHPTITGMKSIGRPYRGVLYAGILITEKGPLLLEYNCRFGDSECQVILPRMEYNLLDLLLAEDLHETEVLLSDKCCVTVCMCTRNYPESVGKQEHIIYGLDNVDHDISVYHYGTRHKDASIVTSTGRVLSITGTGDSLQEVSDRIYMNIARITWNGCYYRKDIGTLV